MTSVVILGPNLINQSRGAYHVHKTGCRSLHSYYGAEHEADKNNPMDFDSESEVAHFVFADFESEMTEDDMLGDIYFHACVSFPKKESVQMTTITFELYNEDMFLSLEIETSNPAETLALLESVPNVRNIKLH